MAMVSHLHQFFNAEMCQSYIHTLRRKDRPLQCPRCQSHNVGPWGTYHYQPGLVRMQGQSKALQPFLKHRPHPPCIFLPLKADRSIYRGL